MIIMLTGPDLKTHSYYANKDNYIELAYIMEEDSQSLYGKKYVLLESNSQFDGSFTMIKSNLELLKESNFWSEVEIGENIYCFTAPGIFGDGWVPPIISVRTIDKIYLSFESGMQNQVDKCQQNHDNCIKYITVLSFIMLINLGIIVILNRKKY